MQKSEIFLYSSFGLKYACLKVLGDQCNRRNASSRFTYFTDWGARWGKVKRINNHRDPSSRSNFAPRRVSKGNDWRSTLRCSINWRITFLSGQCHLHTTRYVCVLSRNTFEYAKSNRRREEEEKDRKGGRGKESEMKSEKNVSRARLENERGAKRAD